MSIGTNRRTAKRDAETFGITWQGHKERKKWDR
jgi:hypothetical protein